MLDLLTTDYVKRLGTITKTTYDALLAALVSQVSCQAAEFMGREPLVGTYSEFLDVLDCAQRNIYRLRAYPVTAVSAVYYDQDLAYGATTLLDSSDYALMRGGSTGELLLLPGFAPFPSALKVTYTGGMAADTSSFMSAYPNITGVLAQQVLYLFQRRREIGISSSGGDAGSVTYFSANEFLPLVKQTLTRYRRML